MVTSQHPKRVVECSDMDGRASPQVQRAQSKIQAICTPLCEEYKRFFWPPEQKGIDDFLLFKKLKKEHEEKIKEESYV